MNGLTPTIEITVNTDGSSHVETRGFSGSGCREATAFLERALGRVTNERLTAEFYEPANTRHHEREAS